MIPIGIFLSGETTHALGAAIFLETPIKSATGQSAR